MLVSSSELENKCKIAHYKLGNGVCSYSICMNKDSLEYISQCKYMNKKIVELKKKLDGEELIMYCYKCMKK